VNFVNAARTCSLSQFRTLNPLKPCILELTLWYVLLMSVERMAQLKSILELDPKNTFARYALGMEHSVAGETDTALHEFRTLLEVDANYANAFFMGAQALQHAERIPESMQWLRDGIACAQRVGNRHAESEMQALLDELEP
jgi:tetratricopeptide (TPR) repeat protein